MKKNLLLLAIIYSTLCIAQEHKSKKKFLSGNFDLGLNFTKNTEETFQFNNNFKLNYIVRNHILSLNNSIDFISKTGQEELLNKGEQDLKYEFTSKNLSIGLSFQNLYDISREIKNRYTSGIGLSYSLFDKKNINIGLALLREKEIVILGDDKLKNRLNSNILFIKNIKESLKVILKNSYQPNLEGFGDFRWISKLSIRMNLSAQFLLSINTRFNYDSAPEIGIPESDYQLINSISYSF